MGYKNAIHLKTGVTINLIGPYDLAKVTKGRKNWDIGNIFGESKGGNTSIPFKNIAYINTTEITEVNNE